MTKKQKIENVLAEYYAAREAASRWCRAIPGLEVVLYEEEEGGPRNPFCILENLSVNYLYSLLPNIIDEYDYLFSETFLALINGDINLEQFIDDVKNFLPPDDLRTFIEDLETGVV